MANSGMRSLALIHCILLALSGSALADGTPDEAGGEITLEEVVVTAALPLDKYLVTSSVITAKEIEEKGAKNLSEALIDVPGLNMHRGKKNANTVDIRGSSVSYSKIYIDGVLVNPLAKVNGSDSVDLDMFPVGNISKIEVIKGPAPVAYGTDAIGGIILITTKSGREQPGGKLSLSGGSDNTRNGSFSYGGYEGRLNYFFNAGTEHTDGFVDNAERKSNYFNTKMSWNLSPGELLTLAGGYSTTDKGTMNAIDPVDGHVISTKSGFWPALKNWKFKDWTKTSLSLDYAKKADAKLDYDLKIYRFTEKQTMLANGADYDAAAAAELGLSFTGGVYQGSANRDVGYSTTRWNYSPWESALKGLELASNYKLTDVHTLSYGLLYNRVDWKNSASIDPVNDPYHPDRLYWKRYESKRYGYYLQDHFTPDDKTAITVGVRRDTNEVINTDKSSIKDSDTNPTVNIVRQLDENTTVRASYGETSSFPLINQLYGTYGNSRLKPEKSKNYEFGLKHRFDRNLSGDIAFFKNDISNRIDTDPVTRIYYNLTSATIKGVELELKQKFSPRLLGFVNYTYLETSSVQNDGTVKELTYTPKNHFNYGVHYQAGNGYRLNLTGRWIDARVTDDTGQADTRTGTDGAKPVYRTLSSYHVVDVQLKRQVNPSFDWYVAVYNLFDKQYQSRLFYPAAGRSVMIGTDYKF